jgi:hypothetical protein
MFGYCFSNCLTWLLNCWVAAFVLPGISDATLIVTRLLASEEVLLADAPEIALKHTASKLAAVTATVVAIRVDFIVVPFR